MTIGLNKRMDYVGNGATADYSFNFKIFAATDLRVTVRDTEGVETLLTYPTHFTVSGVGVAAGGSIALVDGAFDWIDDDGDLEDGFVLTIRRVRAISQTTDIRNQSQVFNDVLEDTYDHLVMIDQQQQDEIDRSIKLPETEEGAEFTLTLPTATERAGGGLYFDDDGNVAVSASIGASLAAILANTLAAAASAVAAAASAAAAAISEAQAAAIVLGNFLQSGTGAVPRTFTSKGRETFSVLDFGAVGDGVTDDTAALNAAAAAARTLGVALLINPTTNFYLISSQVDFTGIKHLEGRNALIKKSANDAYAVWPLRAGAVKIGHQTPGQVLQNYDIWLELQNFTDGSTTDGVIGIQVEGLRSGKFTYFVRGFDEGVYFNGAGATSTNWTDNHFYPLQVFNNGSHHHIHLTGTSYFNSNQFHGGLYYLGTGSKKSGRAPFKITHGGTTSVQVHANTVHDACMNVDGGSYHADNALMVYLENTALGVFNSFSFRNIRYESNNLGAFATDPYMVNIAVNTNAASKYEIDIELLSGVQRWLLNLGGDQKSNSVYVRTAANWSMGGNMARQRIVNRPMFPYQINGSVYVPGRTLYNTTLTAVAAAITNGVAARTTRALGDGTLYSAGSTVIVGKKYKRSVSAQALLLLLPDSTAMTVIAYDAAGAVLTGTAPWYVLMSGARNAAFGGVNVYQGASNWVYIHPDVDSFFIGAGPWTSAARLVPDINSVIEVLYGDNLIPVNDDDTGPNIHGASAVLQSYLPVGTAIDGDASNGWRVTFAHKTTAANARVATDTTIDLAAISTVASGDMIGIELDTAITGTIRQIHWTAVNGAPAGSTVTLSVALPAGVAIGRAIYVTRLVAR